MTTAVESFVREIDREALLESWRDLCGMDRVLAGAGCDVLPDTLASLLNSLMEPYGFHEELSELAVSASDLLGSTGTAGLASRQLLALGEAAARAIETAQDPLARVELLGRLRVSLGRLLLYVNIGALQSLDHAAHRDALTGLRNRRAFDRDTEAFANPGSEVAVALIDVDGLKKINDTQGHPAGDELLKRVGTKLAGACADGEYAYRFGGDEYAFLSRVRGDVDVLSLMESLSEADTPFSYGVASYPAESENIDAVIASADDRMYACKALRRLAGEPPAAQ